MSLQLYASAALESQNFRDLINCLKFAIELDLMDVYRASIELAEKANLNENLM
jgi:hypothetical protein